jgi:hypothetical protein
MGLKVPCFSPNVYVPFLTGEDLWLVKFYHGSLVMKTNLQNFGSHKCQEMDTAAVYLQDDPECDAFQDAIQDETLILTETEKLYQEDTMSHDFQDTVQDESSIPSNLLTYWMHNDVLAHNVPCITPTLNEKLLNMGGYYTS